MTKQYGRLGFIFHDKCQSILFIAILTLTYVVYIPGLEGPFLFDDFANINVLGHYGGVRDYDTLRLYLFSGIAGPTGRPIALLSFLINDTDWPSTPESFKHTNLMLHLLTGTILFGLTRTLLQLNKSLSSSQIGTVALLTTGIWLLHPLLVSTTLYIVQRMAILSTLFALIGLWGYLHGRISLQQQSRKGYLWMSISLALCTLLATFSKENGVLLLPLALLMEQLILKRQLSIQPDKRWIILFLWLPVAALTIYLISRGLNNSGFEQRPFSLFERLLTEPRILFDYLRWWFIPSTDSPGLLTQDFPISKGLLTPPSTLYAIIFLLSMILASILIRKKHYYLSFAILFFFIAHSLEGGPIPLELYFEHRNYLPSVFLALPIAVKLSQMRRKSSVTNLVSIAILLGLALITYQRAINWSDLTRLSFHWAEIHPYSQRAQRNAALVAENVGRPELAIQILNDAMTKQPDNFPIRIHLLILNCQYLKADESELNNLIYSAKHLPYNFKTFNLLESLVELGPTDYCKGISFSHIHDFLKALLNNPNAKDLARPQGQIHHFLGTLALQNGDGTTAAKEFKISQDLYPGIEAGLLQTSLLATHHNYIEALEHLALTEQLHPELTNYSFHLGSLDYKKEIKLLRKTLMDDLEAQETHDIQRD